MRQLISIAFLLAVVCRLQSQTNLYHPGVENYHCVVCGKGPLRETIWRYKWGVVCDECQKITTRCSICGLPVKAGDGNVITGDGRVICRFDKTNCILTLEQAQEIFDKAREEVIDLYGPDFALKNTNVTLKLFDVDYWSEHGGRGGLHAFGFASSRPLGGGKFIHEVIMLSGEPREQMMSVAAHEYTHLWINENCPTNHSIDGDTVEAICELTAYKLMQKESLPEMQKQILANPYTHGQIKTLIAVERRMSTDYVLSWVRSGKGRSFDDDVPNIAPETAPVEISYAPRVLPPGLKFNGIIAIGAEQQAVINGTAFATGNRKDIKLRDRTVSVKVDEISDSEVTVELNGSPSRITLKKGVEKILP